MELTDRDVYDLIFDRLKELSGAIKSLDSHLSKSRELAKGLRFRRNSLLRVAKGEVVWPASHDDIRRSTFSMAPDYWYLAVNIDGRCTLVRYLASDSGHLYSNSSEFCSLIQRNPKHLLRAMRRIESATRWCQDRIDVFNQRSLTSISRHLSKYDEMAQAEKVLLQMRGGTGILYSTLTSQLNVYYHAYQQSGGTPSTTMSGSLAELVGEDYWC